MNPGVKQPHEMKDLDMMRYLGYIEGRPGVEKEDGHGLFGVSGDVPISVARQMAEQHSDSTIWSHIISMDEIEAKEKGYDQRSAWKDLVLALSPRIAKIYNITLENLVINAAFHNNTDNPHIHMMFYSTDPREGKVFGSREEKHNLYLLAFRIQEKKRSTAGKLCFSNRNKAGCERLLCNFILSRSRFVVNKTREQIVSLCQRVVHFFNNSSLTHPVYSKEKNL